MDGLGLIKEWVVDPYRAANISLGKTAYNIASHYLPFLQSDTIDNYFRSKEDLIKNNPTASSLAEGAIIDLASLPGYLTGGGKGLVTYNMSLANELGKTRGTDLSEQERNIRANQAALIDGTFGLINPFGATIGKGVKIVFNNLKNLISSDIIDKVQNNNENN